MKEIHIPCKECISYARCIAKDYLACSILFKELDEPHVMRTMADFSSDKNLLSSRQKLNINNNNEKLRVFTKYLKQRRFILGFNTVHIFGTSQVKAFKGGHNR